MPHIIRGIACCLCTALAGCSGPRATEPRLDPNTLDDSGFQFYLNEVPLVTVDEAYRAMLILADGQDDSANFEERAQKLESREIARSAWDLQPDHVIDTGSVAYMVCRICELPGGLNARTFGRMGLGDRRYATRELIYRDMIDESVDYQYMTGSLLFALMRKADALQAEKGLYDTKGVDLTDEGDRDASGALIVPEPAIPRQPDNIDSGA